MHGTARSRRVRRLTLRVLLGVAACVAASGGWVPSAAGSTRAALPLYQKAEAKLEQQAYDEALTLIEKAIAKQPESDVFRMGIQTRHYFPYLVRGTIRLRMGDAAAALEDFAHEREQGRIGKVPALDARLETVLAEAQSIDTERPEVEIADVEVIEFETVARDGADVEQVKLRLEGRALDTSSGIRSITAAGQELTIVVRDGAQHFDDVITVDATAAAIEVAVTDAAGNVGTVEHPLAIPPLDLGEDASRIHAVLVGVNEYDKSYRTDSGDCSPEVRSRCGDASDFTCYSLPDLNYAAHDAQRMADLLRRRGVPADNIHLFASRDGNLDATRDSVLEALDGLRSADGDKVLFFFSGHGVSSKSEQNLMLLSDTQAWECGSEDEDNVLETTALDVGEVARRLMETPMRERYIMLDACRSPLTASRSIGQQSSPGFSVEGLKGLRVAMDQAPEDTGMEPVVFFSTLERKVSVEWGARSSGYFTWYLLQGLRQDLPLDALRRYVQAQVKRQTKQDLCDPDAPDSSCPYLQAPFLQLPEPLEQDYELQSSTVVLGGGGR